MGRTVIIRVAASLADGLIDAGLAEELASEERAGALELAVDVSLVIEEVASVLLAVAAGANGVRAVVDWVRNRSGADVVITIHTHGVERVWTLKPGAIDDSIDGEVSAVLQVIADGGEEKDSPPPPIEPPSPPH